MPGTVRADETHAGRRTVVILVRMSAARTNVVFIGHGSPMNIVRDNGFTQSLALLGRQLGRPEAVLVISAHWLTRGETRVATNEAPRTIHDFGGFPAELYQMRYAAPGSPAKAQQLIESVRSISVRADPQMGLDHGAWSVLLHMWPAANVPVFQLSIDWSKPAVWHLALGRELSAMREQGVLILGSGNIVHNLSQITGDENDPQVPDWASQFDSWAATQLSERNDDALARYELEGPGASTAVAMNDHYLPLLYSVGALADGEKICFTHSGFQNSSISMRCFASVG